MVIVTEPITLAAVAEMAETKFGDLVKAVVDVERGIMAIDGELHADEEALLLENASAQRDLWGISLYPSLSGDDWVDFDSFINIRPSQGNRSRGVKDPAVRRRILMLVDSLIAK